MICILFRDGKQTRKNCTVELKISVKLYLPYLGCAFIYMKMLASRSGLTAKS